MANIKARSDKEKGKTPANKFQVEIARRGFACQSSRLQAVYWGRVKVKFSEVVPSRFLTCKTIVCPGEMVFPAFPATRVVVGVTSSLKVFLTFASSINSKAPMSKFSPVMINCFLLTLTSVIRGGPLMTAG